MNTTIRVFIITILSGMVLAGCSSLPAEKQHFQKEVKKALDGDLDKISTVQNVYCTGDYYKLFKTNQNSAKCLSWTKFYLDEFNKSQRGKDAATGNIRSINSYDEFVYFYMLRKLVNGDTSSHYRPEKTALIGEIEAIDTLHAKENLYKFFTKYYRHDKDKSKRKKLAFELCDNVDNSGKYCSFYATRLYNDGQYAEALTYYEKHGADYNYSSAEDNLAQLYLDPPQGFERKPEKAIKLLKSAYLSSGGWLDKCIDKKGKSHKDCQELQSELDNDLFRARVEIAFKKDEALNREIREDKYKMALANHLREKEYQQALLYFELLERIEYPIPASMLFFKAEAQLNTDDKQLAKQTYSQYLNEQGRKGTYYKQALKRLSEIDSAANQ